MSEAQVGDEIARHALAEEIAVAVHAVRHAGGAQGGSQHVGLAVGAIQHRGIARMLQQPAVDQRADLVRHRLRFGLGVLGGKEPGQWPRQIVGDQRRRNRILR